MRLALVLLFDADFVAACVRYAERLLHGRSALACVGSGALPHLTLRRQSCAPLRVADKPFHRLDSAILSLSAATRLHPARRCVRAPRSRMQPILGRRAATRGRRLDRRRRRSSRWRE